MFKKKFFTKFLLKANRREQEYTSNSEKLYDNIEDNIYQGLDNIQNDKNFYLQMPAPPVILNSVERKIMRMIFYILVVLVINCLISLCLLFNYINC